MIRYTTRLFAVALVAFLVLSVRPAEGAKGKTFVDSDDAKEKDEPAKFLPDYDKLTKGKDADWVYFPNGSLRSFKTAHVKEFEENGRGREARDAAHEGRDYMIQTIVDDCLRDGQFDDCDLTMRDLAIIVETLERTVSNIYHHRIDYPGFEFNRGARRKTGELGPVSAPEARPAAGVRGSDTR